MKIVVRKDLCCGTQLCVKAAPGVFQLDALGYNRMDGCAVPAGMEDAAKRAAALCPESAIRLVRESAAEKA